MHAGHGICSHAGHTLCIRGIYLYLFDVRVHDRLEPMGDSRGFITAVSQSLPRGMACVKMAQLVDAYRERRPSAVDK